MRGPFYLEAPPHAALRADDSFSVLPVPVYGLLLPSFLSPFLSRPFDALEFSMVVSRLHVPLQRSQSGAFCLRKNTGRLSRLVLVD